MLNKMLSRYDSVVKEAKRLSVLEEKAWRESLEKNKEKLLLTIRESAAGSHTNTLLKTVFGPKPLFYADYTASGKSLSFIEDYIQNSVLPLYANTHSMLSATGKQTMFFREEAR